MFCVSPIPRRSLRLDVEWPAPDRHCQRRVSSAAPARPRWLFGVEALGRNLMGLTMDFTAFPLARPGEGLPRWPFVGGTGLARRDRTLPPRSMDAGGQRRPTLAPSPWVQRVLAPSPRPCSCSGGNAGNQRLGWFTCTAPSGRCKGNRPCRFRPATGRSAVFVPVWR